MILFRFQIITASCERSLTLTVHYDHVYSMDVTSFEFPNCVWKNKVQVADK